MPFRIRLFPLSAVLFPGAMLNLHIFEPRYKQLLSDCLDAGEGFGVVLIREGSEAGDPDAISHEVGTIATIGDVTQLPFGRYYISTTGTDRFRLTRIVSREPYLIAEAELIPDDEFAERELEELASQVRDLFAEYVMLAVEFSGSPTTIEVPDDATGTSYIIGDALQVADSMKQRLLELTSTRQRLSVELGFLRRLLPQLRKLLERKQVQLALSGDEPANNPNRTEQERYFGKYFSQN